MRTDGTRLAPILAAAALLAGCRLVDQTTFGGRPLPPAPDTLAAAVRSDGRQPLLVIHPGDNVPYADRLRAAIEASQAVTPDAHYRVQATVPQGGDATALAAASDAARQMMDAIIEDGVTADRLTLTSATDPASSAQEVRLYAR